MSICVTRSNNMQSIFEAVNAHFSGTPGFTLCAKIALWYKVFTDYDNSTIVQFTINETDYIFGLVYWYFYYYLQLCPRGHSCL